MMPIVEDEDGRNEARMLLAQRMAGSIQDLVHKHLKGVGFMLILVDGKFRETSMVGDLSPERLLDVLKYQVEVIERAKAEGKFNPGDVSGGTLQ